MTREKLICDAIEAAKAQGIIIWPGAVFDWTDRPDALIFEGFKMPVSSGALPSACSAFGAIQLLLGRTRDNGPEGFHKKECDYLGVGLYWLYRFHMGFDRGQQLVYKAKNKKDKLVDKKCDVSKLGLKLRKRYVNTHEHGFSSRQQQ